MVIRCGTCLSEKQPDLFSPRERVRSKPICLPCGAERAKKYRVKNNESLNRKRREYYSQNKRGWRDQTLKKLYGISVDEWDILFSSQEGRCAICKTDTPKGRGWQTDHCHKTNKIRGILCHHCNSLLGHALDSVDILKSAEDYLNKSRNA